MLSDFCSACCLGKAHRLPSFTSTATYNKPLELIFCDLWGLAPVESFEGYTYFLTCVDAYSRFTWIFPLKLKSHTLITFQNFIKMVELQYNTPIKSVQTDGGGEFRPFTSYLNSFGIIHRLTCPHTHHQNGSVERKHRHMVETGLTLLAHAKLPLHFWDQAFVTATYLINRMPSATLANKSPFFLLNLKFPDYKFLRSFGCACYLFIRPYNSHKLDFHSKECIFLGYSSSHKGYKCLDSTGKLFISKDVLFDETKYPYPTMFSTDSSSSVQTPVHVSSNFSPKFPHFPTVSTSGNSSPSVSSSSPQSTQHMSTPQMNPQHNSPPQSPTHQTLSPTNSSTPPLVFNPTPITILSPSPQTSPSQSSTPPSHNSTASSSTPVSPPSPHRIHPANTHNMATRGKKGIVQPRLHPTLLLTHIEPTSYKQAMKTSEWCQAMQIEYNALMNNHTWSLVHLPPGREAIGCKWIFRLKQNPDGSVNKHKARLMAKGFHHKQGFDYNETFSPVVKPVTVRTILTLAVTNKWFLQQLDINNAFLNGSLNEEVYMIQPPGFEASDASLVCKLHKALYGLKQAPRA